MKKLILLVLFAITVSLPAGVAGATPPTSCTGEFEETYSELRSIKLVGSNIIMVQYSEFQFTGCFEGLYSGENRVVIRPSGYITMHGTREFEGDLVDGGETWSGTAVLNQSGWGDGVTFTVRGAVLSGTGDLANLRATSFVVGDFATNSGTFVIRYHFDP